MTPGEKNIVKSLIAVAWADGQMEASEARVVEGMLVGFDATPAEEKELLEYAKTPRSLDKDIPLDGLETEDREILLSNAALLSLADGTQTADEAKVLSQLVKVLNLGADESQKIIGEAKAGALSLSSRSLD